MGIYILLGIAVIVIFLPKILWRIYVSYRHSQSVKEIVSKPFVCPNCGHRFYTQEKILRSIGENKAILKCPKCGKRDLCGRPYDFDV